MHPSATADILQKQQIWRLKVAYLIGVIFAVNDVFFACMWAMAIVNTGQSIAQTFSYMLAHSTVTQITFSAWWVYYLIVNIIVFLILLEKCSIYPYAHLEHQAVQSNSNRNQHAYTSCIWFYIFLNTLKMVSLLLILLFPDEGDTKDIHYVFAVLAFGSAITGCFVIMVVRLWRAEWYKERNVILVSFTILNVLSVIAQGVMAIMFIVTPIDNRGVYEFTMALLIMLDLFYILMDFVIDAYDIEIVFLHHMKSQ